MNSREEYNNLIDVIHYYKLARKNLCVLTEKTNDNEYHIELMKLNQQITTLENKKTRDFSGVEK